MDSILSPDKDLLDVIMQAILFVIPVVLSWFVRNYIRGHAAEKRISTIVSLSNAAIDYVENLDRRGSLSLPPAARKGGYKLSLAGRWLEKELKASGVNMPAEEAQEWVASEFQRRMGGVQQVNTLAELAKQAVSMVGLLEKTELVDLPPEADRLGYLTNLAADWIVAQYAKDGGNISHERARTWVNAEMLESQQSSMVKRPQNGQLDALAQQAVDFLNDLKSRGRLALRSDVSLQQVETDVATAWLLTEIAKQGLSVTSDEIARAIQESIQQTRTFPPQFQVVQRAA